MSMGTEMGSGICYGRVAEKSARELALVRAQQSVVRAAKRREKREAEGKPAPRKLAGAPVSVWTPEMVERLKVLIAEGRKAADIFNTGEFPGLSKAAIKGRFQGLIHKADRRGGCQGLGLNIGQSGGEPDWGQVDERDERVNSERDLKLDPNHVLLGDPSPARLAVARDLDGRRSPRHGAVTSKASLEVDPNRLPFSISAVPKGGPRNIPRDHHYAE